jgi:hypothetical protein
MKFTAIAFLASLASTAAMTVTKDAAKAKVLRAARRVENREEQEVDYSFLMDYSLKMISCAADATVTDDQGALEYGAVLFRLCPTANGCNSDSLKGCGAGHGDFIVGMATFVEAFFEDQRDNMQWDDNFKVQDYMQCREYKAEGQNKNDNGDQEQIYIGPSCIGGSDIGLGVFSDEGCITPSDVSFEDVSGGWTLPYSTGGLVSTECLDCTQANDDGTFEGRQMCSNLYAGTPYKCESSMATYSYYGQDTAGCEATAAMMPIVKKSGKGGKIFGWFVFVMVVAGLVGYVMWWRKSKSAFRV